MSHRSDYVHADYRQRLLACLAAALLVVVGLVKLWPIGIEPEDDRRLYVASEREAIQIDEIQPTRQAEAAPPPAAPPIPIVVPDDVVLTDEELDFSDHLLTIDEPGDDRLVSEGDPDETTSAASGPTVGPRTVRFVEPEYTREARRRRIRAELVVRVLVNERGKVESATIVERFLVDRDGTSRTAVAELGYGLEEAALAAADRWMFRPAQKNGVPVASQTELTFTFGVDA